MRRLLCVLAGAAVLAVGCGENDEDSSKVGSNVPTGAGEVSGSGFVTRRPDGYDGAGTGQPSGIVLTLVGPFEGTGGSPPTIVVARSPRLPNATPRKLRSVLRAQVEGMGAQRVRKLPDRRIDGKPAVGVISERTGRGGDELVERSYRVVHADAIYSIASTVLVRERREGERALATVLDDWRWTR